MDLNELLAQTPLKAKAVIPDFDVVAGKTIRTEVSPAGYELVIGTVPADKRWRIGLIVHIEELDA